MLVDSLEPLANLGVDTRSWDPIFCKLILSKWDSETLSLFEQRLVNSKEVPTIGEIRKFMLWRFDTFQSSTNSVESKSNSKSSPKAYTTKTKRRKGKKSVKVACLR